MALPTVNRRALLRAGVRAAPALLPFNALGFAARGHDAALCSCSSLLDMIGDPLLRRFFSRSPGGIAPDGLAGLNRGGFRIIEEQRTGAGALTHGLVTGRQDWRALGWKALDLGISYQERNGGFDRYGYYHSENLFLEALARALLIDPENRTPARLDALSRGTAWLMSSDARERDWDEPYTHRFYICAATFALSSAALGDQRLLTEADRWAKRALDRQRRDGTNPEQGGFDVSYQMVGPLFATRYVAYARPAIRDRVAEMILKACTLERSSLDAAGNLSTANSTRTGHDLFGAQIKQVNYPEIFEGLVYSYRLTGTAWLLDMANAIGRPRRWLTA